MSEKRASIAGPEPSSQQEGDAAAELCQRIDVLLQRRLHEHLQRIEQVLVRREVAQVNMTHSLDVVAPNLEVSTPRKSKPAVAAQVSDEGGADAGVVAGAHGRNVMIEDASHAEQPCANNESVSPIAANWRDAPVSKTLSAMQWEEKEKRNRAMSPLQRRVSGNRFEIFWACAIFSYAIFVGAQAHCAAIGMWQDEKVWLGMNWAYSICFLIELMLRMIAHGKSFFTDADCAWNYFDLSIGTLSIVEMGFDIWLLSADTEDQDEAQANSAASMRVLRVLRVARLVRIVRIVRIVRFIRALRALVYSILNTLRSLLWAMILLFIIIYVFAVVFTQAVADHRDSGLVLDAGVLLGWGRFWGDLPTAMLTLFECVCNGLSWYEALDPLIAINGVWGMLFVFYICFAALAVMNVVTGVFCQTAIDGAQYDQELLIQEQLKNRSKFRDSIRQIFQDIDEDGHGMITLDQLEEHIGDSRMQAYFSALELETEDALAFFRLLDASDGIDCEDFVMGCTRLKGSAKAIHLAQLIHENKRMRQKVSSLLRAMETSDIFRGSQVLPWNSEAIASRAPSVARPRLANTAQAAAPSKRRVSSDMQGSVSLDSMGSLLTPSEAVVECSGSTPEAGVPRLKL